MMILALAVALALLLFYIIVFQLDIPGTWKFLLVVIEMVALNQLLIRRYKMPSELGLVLLKSRRGVDFIDVLAKNERLASFLADVGATMSYGLLSAKLMRRNVSAKSAACGFALLAFLMVYVAPVAFAFLLYVVGIGSASTSASESLGGSQDAGLLIVSLMLLAGGLFLLILFGIVYYGIFIFRALVTSLFFGTDAISRVSAGGDILLPGINLPFFEGIIALAVVMAVHEGAHAVLTRIARVPLLSSGIVLFGIIPIGAFVEPDEKRLEKADAPKQTRVLVAGPTANMMASAALFLVFLAFFMGTGGMREGVLYIHYNESWNGTKALPEGTLVYEMDGIPAGSIDFEKFSLEPGQEVRVLTSRGEALMAADESAKLGISFLVLGKDSISARYAEPALQFAYIALGLSLALNFVVGIVNILPIPLFDGYRIVDVNVGNKMIVKALSYGALFFFILNFLPRFFQ